MPGSVLTQASAREMVGGDQSMEDLGLAKVPSLGKRTVLGSIYPIIHSQFSLNYFMITTVLIA